MTEVVVTCPDCRLRVRVTHSEQQIIDVATKCKHWHDPTNCPMLTPALSIARQAALATMHLRPA